MMAVSVAARLTGGLGLIDKHCAHSPLVILGVIDVLPDVLGDGHGELAEHLLDVDVLLGADLHEGAVAVVGEHASLLHAHLPLLAQVALVPHDQFRQPAGPVLLELHHPVAHVLEGAPVVDRVHDHDPRGALEVGIGEGAEALLAGSVPELQLDAALVVAVGEGHLDDLGAEVDADGGRVRHGIVLVDEAQQDVGLAHCRVPDDDDLGQVIVVALLRLGQLTLQPLHLRPV